MTTADAEELLARAGLASSISDITKGRHLTQKAAAEVPPHRREARSRMDSMEAQDKVSVAKHRNTGSRVRA